MRLLTLSQFWRMLELGLAIEKRLKLAVDVDGKKLSEGEAFEERAKT